MTAKLPPNAVDFEQLIIGACLIDAKGLKEATKILKDNQEVFYDPRHKEIYRAICFLQSKNRPVDMMTVIKQLKDTQELERAGGDLYIIDLITKISSSANIEYHCRIVYENYMKRVMIESANYTIARAYAEGTDPFEILEYTVKQTNSIHNYLSGQKPIKSFFDVHQEFIEYVKAKSVPGVPMPFEKLQFENMGWQNSDLVIVAARPGMGKTALALEFGKHAAKNDYPVHFFSLEMADIQLHKRMVANELQIDANKIRKKQFEGKDLEKIFSASELEKLPFYYDDTVLVWDEIKARARYVAEEKKTKLIIIDYLQLITTKGRQSTYERVSTVSRELKLLAKELNVPIICLSQLSRDVEGRPSKRPQLSDLRESGAIEQDADIVLFPFRPEYYGIETWDAENEISETSTKGKALLITAKNRHCGDSELVIGWNPNFQKFYDLNKLEFNIGNTPLPQMGTEVFDDMPF